MLLREILAAGESYAQRKTNVGDAREADQIFLRILLSPEPGQTMLKVKRRGAWSSDCRRRAMRSLMEFCRKTNVPQNTHPRR